MFTDVADVFLAITLAFCIFTDCFQGRITNSITVPAMLLGLALGAAEHGWHGLMDSAFGLIVGGGILFFPFLIGGIGGGDVKLAAAIGALTNWLFVLETVAYAFILALVFVLILNAVKGKLVLVIKNCARIVLGFFLRTQRFVVETNVSSEGVPFAVCLAGGAIGAKMIGFVYLL